MNKLIGTKGCSTPMGDCRKGETPQVRGGSAQAPESEYPVVEINKTLLI